MSSLRSPVGKEPNGVYWRRRAMVLGALLLVIVVIVLIVVGRGGRASEASPTASATARAQDAGDTEQSSSATGKATSSASTAAAADGATCGKSQIVLKPITDKTTYAPTEQPEISMSITNTGKNACHMDLGSAQQVLTITSGEETYWTSKDCQTGGTNQDVTLEAQQTLTTPAIAWDRTRSSTTTCDASRSSVPADGASYHLDVAVGNLVSSASTQFVLN